MGNLLCTLKPLDGESLKSFLIRLSMENNYMSISWIYEFSRLTKRSTYNISPKKNDLKALMELVNMPSFELWKLTFVCEFGDYLSDDYYSNLIYRNGLSSYHSKICPLCIKENGFEQKYWDLNINIACDKHGILLINKCCKCNNLIPSKRDSIDHCICGNSLKELPTIKASKELIEIAKLLRFSSTKDPALKLTKNNPLYELSLKHVVCLLLFFSRELSIYFDYKKIGNKISTLDRSYQQLLIDTFNIFFNWPNNYHSFLNTFQNLRRDKKGSMLQLSGIYIGIHRKFTLPIFSFLREEFYNQLMKDENRNYKVVRSKISLKEQSNFLNFIEITKMHNMKPNTVKKLLDNGILVGTYKKFSNHEQVLISKESFEDFNKLLDKNLSLNDVSTYLGITERKVIQLKNQGLIKAILGPEIGFHKWLFSKDSVQDLLNKLIQLVPREISGKANFGEIINFNQAARISSGYEIIISNFINLILQEVVQPLGLECENIGLNQLIFNKTELVKSIKNWKERNSCELSATTISKIIDENYDYVLMWLNAGLIKNNRNNQGKNRVNVDDLKHFQKTYISLNKLSTKSKIHSTKLRRMLFEQEVYPVFGSETLGGYLYLINELLKSKEFQYLDLPSYS